MDRKGALPMRRIVAQPAFGFAAPRGLAAAKKAALRRPAPMGRVVRRVAKQRLRLGAQLALDAFNFVKPR